MVADGASNSKLARPRPIAAGGSVLYRYLFREGLAAWLAVTFVLLAIMLATRFARFLAEAAAGQLPREFLLKVVALSSLQYLVILVPVSLLLAIQLSLGRMYRDQEVAAMTGCGVGPALLYRPFMALAALLAMMTAALSFQVGPWAGRQVDHLVKDARRLVQYTPFEAGQFKSVAGGRGVFYTAGVDPDSGELETVFALLHESGGDSVLSARRGSQSLDTETGERIVRLDNGHRMAGTPGSADWDLLTFETLTTRVAPPEAIYLSSKRKIAATSALWLSDSLEDRAELEWRIAAPVSVLLLAMLAVPLSHASPREGRYGKLVLGILAYLVYSNLLTLGQTAIARGLLPASIGLWWVHGLTAAVVLLLIARRVGWLAQSRVPRGAPA